MYSFIIQCQFCGEPIDFAPHTDNIHTYVDRYGNNNCSSVYPEYRDRTTMPAHQPAE